MSCSPSHPLQRNIFLRPVGIINALPLMLQHNQQKLFLKAKTENTQIYTAHNHYLSLGWLCGGLRRWRSLDFIFSSWVYWPQNDKDTFPKPIKKLRCCCYHVTLAALKDADARPCSSAKDTLLTQGSTHKCMLLFKTHVSYMCCHTHQ